MRIALLIATLLLPAASMAIVVQTHREVRLSARDTAAVEAVACQKPYGVPARKSIGQRSILRGGWKQPLAARVTCQPHVVTDQYQAYNEAWCERRSAGWTCTSVVPHLLIEFMDRGPYDAVVSTDLGQAVAAIRRLEQDLRAHPEVLDGEHAEWLHGVGRAGSSEDLSIYLGTPRDCYAFTVNLAREPGDELRPPQFERGCIEE